MKQDRSTIERETNLVRRALVGRAASLGLVRVAVGLGWLVLAAGCGGSQPRVETAVAASSLGGVLEYFPLEPRTVGTFVTRTDLGQETLVVMEFERPRPERGEIWIAGHRQSFLLGEDAVERAEGGFVLHAPLEVGNSFQGAFGRVSIVQVGLSVSVPAGSFSDCLVTREESANPPKSVETTFCAGVGIVRLRVSGAGGGEVSEVESILQAYGPRADLGPVP